MNSSDSSPSQRHSLWLTGGLLAFAALAFVIGLGEAPIERAEIYFLDAARAMVERADWLVPYYRGLAFYDKPPMTYWLLAASFDAFGPSLFAGRLVAALLALGTLIATHRLARRLVGANSPDDAAGRAAFFATAILATSYAFVSFARLTMSDMLLTLLTLLAGAAYLRSELEGRQIFLILCGSLLGLGFLTKGPIAWVYFGALLVAFSVIERRLPKIFTSMGLIGTIAAVAIGASWFLFVYQREGIEPLKWFFLRENLQRFAATTYDTDQPFWYYFLIYAVEGLPWSILAIPAAIFAFRSGTPKVFRVLLVWSLLMLVPLSLSKGKIDYYLLPLLPPLSILIGAYLAIGRPAFGVLRTLALAMTCLLVAAIFFPMLPVPYAPSTTTVQAMRAFLGLSAVACFATSIRPRVTAIVSVAATSVLGTALFLFGAIVPAYRTAQPTEILLDDIARERAFTPELEVAVCDDALRLQRDILFSLRIPVVEHCQLWAVISSQRKFLVIVTPTQEAALRKAESVRHIETLPLLPADVTRIGTLLSGPEVSKVGLLANFETRDLVAIQKRRREFKRWLDTPEGMKAEADRLEREQREAEVRKRAGGN